MRKTGIYFLFIFWHIFQNLVNMTKYKKLGEKVKKLRKARDWTQEKLAEAANVDPKTIIELEAGKRANPTLQTLNKLARALKTSLEELLST